ncbi:uncharacterized protein LOC129596220 [Paramacrobiotus metropolitanus]|uniref:uncharacterized protein LOC129596220 n=1 Tax=Paramacrobiotus metropolitanus TaxID=2943436 RepID=UPI0024457C17|nr:uncharacterized protein LOC129596220 [Paramacrobiotus metropolitanus]
MRCRLRSSCLLVGALITVWVTLSLLIFRHSLYGSSPETVENISDVVKDIESSPATSTTPLSTTTTLPRFDTYVPLVVILSGPGKVAVLLSGMTSCLKSVIESTNAPINVILVCERKVFELAEAAIKRNVTSDRAKLRMSYLNMDDAFSMGKETMSSLKEQFGAKGVNFPSSAEFLPLVMDQILPLHRRAILINTNTVFDWDVRELLDKSFHLPDSRLIGVVRDTVALPSGNATGFTKPKSLYSFQAVFFDMDRMRHSVTWPEAMMAKSVANLLHKYFHASRAKDVSFGDMLFILSFEHPEWFYFLACGSYGHGCFIESSMFREEDFL